jgi:prephenate dehydrogenase
MTDIRIGMAGYGEVGRIFSEGLKDKPGVASAIAWDLKFQLAAMGPELRANAHRMGIDAAGGMAQLCEAATLIISAVTASSTLAVAQEAALHIRPGAFFLDLNSASPGT